MDALLTITDAAAALRAGEVSSVELVRRAIDVADAVDPQIGTFLDRYTEQSLAAASAADESLASGAEIGPLTGIPLGVKDIITTSEGPTTAQSLVHDPEWNGRRDAVVVSRLRGAGGVIMGKATTAEFAIGEPDEGGRFPILRNPWDLDRSPGGSSSGTGSGIASGQFLGGLGTDTGGSIRIPAAFCGVSGLMPTFGRVPKSGCVPLGYSLDHIGPLARSAADCALLLQVLAGYDASDPSCVDEPVGDYVGALTGDLTGVRVGVDSLARFPSSADDPAAAGVLAAAVQALRAAGAEVVDVELPLYQELTLADFVTMFSEATAYHQPDFEQRWSLFGTVTRTRIAGSVCYSAADFVQAQRVRRAGMRLLAELYRDVDLIVTPTATLGAIPLSRYVSLLDSGDFASIHTAYWNATGNPVLSVPMGFTADGMPLGMQIAGRPFDEALVLRAGDAYQRHNDWHLRVPPLVAAAQPSLV